MCQETALSLQAVIKQTSGKDSAAPPRVKESPGSESRMRVLEGSSRFFDSSAVLGIVASMCPGRVRYFPSKSFAGAGIIAREQRTW